MSIHVSDIFAVIADVHGNLEALCSVLADCKRVGVDDIICLGDVVGYGADSEKCAELIFNYTPKIRMIMGNHESMLLGEADTDHCSELGKEAMERTKFHMAQSEWLEVIEKLPSYIEEEHLLFTHTGIKGDKDWIYLSKTEDVKRAMYATNVRITLYGHTHRYRISSYDLFSDCVHDELLPKHNKFILEDDKRYFINVGSVGQARASRTTADYLLYKSSGGKIQIEFRHIPYNSYCAYRKMVNSGASQALSAYLIREKWRRKLYDCLSHWGFRIHRKGVDPQVTCEWNKSVISKPR